MPTTDEQFMRQALALARDAYQRGEVPVGAVVVHGGKVIGRGYNLRETNQDPLAHAEIEAIREAAKATGTWRLEDCDLYVTLEPCPMCAGAIVNARMRRVVFGASDPKAGACGTLFNVVQDSRLNHRAVLLAGVLADECGEILKNFFRDARNGVLPREGRRESNETSTHQES